MITFRDQFEKATWAQFAAAAMPMFDGTRPELARKLAGEYADHLVLEMRDREIPPK
jgi:hypothetical protein